MLHLTQNSPSPPPPPRVKCAVCWFWVLSHGWACRGNIQLQNTLSLKRRCHHEPSLPVPFPAASATTSLFSVAVALPALHISHTLNQNVALCLAFCPVYNFCKFIYLTWHMFLVFHSIYDGQHVITFCLCSLNGLSLVLFLHAGSINGFIRNILGKRLHKHVFLLSWVHHAWELDCWITESLSAQLFDELPNGLP